MNDNPMKLPRKALAQLMGIVPNSIDRNIDFALQWLFRATQLKTDNICKVVVLQVLLIDL